MTRRPKRSPIAPGIGWEVANIPEGDTPTKSAARRAILYSLNILFVMKKIGRTRVPASDGMMKTMIGRMSTPDSTCRDAVRTSNP